MSVAETVLAGLWLMLPALVPNSAAVFWGGGTPMDFGRSWRGRRILGDGKTWRGFFGGSLTGALVGIIILSLSEVLGAQSTWGYGGWPESLVTPFALAFGSLSGDAVGSFVKRRLGVERGARAPVLDQYNFVVGAVLLALLTRPGWFFQHYVTGHGWVALLVFLAIVPLLHRGVNIIGYKMGKKDVPW
ncbi:MAG: CDP-2,3-bis-(O-geranylgeranyl)-sn-glycerol synthase [Thermoplasmata archaeon]